jgi:polysaccharide export outer membrane protein
MTLRLFPHSMLLLTIAAVATAGQAQSSSPSVQIGPSYSSASAAATLMGGLKGGATGPVTSVPEDFSKLKIAPGFLLDVQVYDEADLSGQLRVGEDGNVSLPFIGAVHVAGGVTTEAQKAIEQSLKAAEILNNPQVTVNVIQYEPLMVTVLGEVNSPGRLQMLTPHSLLDVVSFAGGESQLAGSEIDVRHEEAGQVITTGYHYGRNSNGDSIAGVIVHNGDTVLVPRAGVVYVLGAVTRPGGYLMQEDGKLDAAQALALAFGTVIQAKTTDIHIIRRKSDGSYVEFPLNYQKMVDGKITPPQLQAQDIVYVPMSHVKATLTDATGIIGSATSASIYAIK